MISTKSLSTININRILRTLWEQEPISRIGISRLLDLSKSTVTLIMPQLIDRGIVIEKSIGEAADSGGRRPVALGINDRYGAIIGIEIQTNLARIIAVSLDGRIILQETKSIDFRLSLLSNLLEDTIRHYKQLLEDRNWRVIGASLGVAGIIDPYSRCIRNSNPLSVTEPIVLDDSMEERLKIPVFLENDTKCCCWGDLANRRSEHPQHFMYVLGEVRQLNVNDPSIQGLAVGMAFVIDGKVHYGHNFTSGEFSSVFKQDSAVTQFSMPKTENVSPSLLHEKERKRVFQELAENVALIANVLNLQSVGIAGDIVHYREELTPILDQAIVRNWSYPNQSEIHILYTPFGEWAVAYGAAALIIEQLFALPKVNEDQESSLPVGIDLFDLIDSFN